MIRRPPRSTLDRSSAASDVYKRQDDDEACQVEVVNVPTNFPIEGLWIGSYTFDKYPSPVSYTHLRAHETVLDLVCRLLLEKKKPHISTTTLVLLRYTTTRATIDQHRNEWSDHA